MPIAVTEPTMLPTEEILRTALAEHDAQEGEAVDRSEVINKAFAALDSPGNASRFVDRTTYTIYAQTIVLLDSVLPPRDYRAIDRLSIPMYATRHRIPLGGIHAPRRI